MWSSSPCQLYIFVAETPPLSSLLTSSKHQTSYISKSINAHIVHLTSSHISDIQMGVQVLTRPVLRSQLPPLAIAGAAAVAAFGAYQFFSTPARKLGEPPKTFSSGPAFKSLKLHSVEKLNHDSSRFRFTLPSEDAVSGLSLTCES